MNMIMCGVVCGVASFDSKNSCIEEQSILRDGHHNLNCAKLKQAKLKLKLCKN